MVQAGIPQPFRTGTGSGYWNPVNITIPRPGGFSDPVRVQVRFWDSQGGTLTYFEQAQPAGAKVGFSKVLQLVLSQTGATPLTGLQSAGLIPVLPPLHPAETRTVHDTMAVPNGLQLAMLCQRSVGRIRWFQLSFANAGEAVIQTQGSSIDTVLSIFTSCLLSANTCAPVACNDDAAPGQTMSEVRFQAQANVIYAVAVGGRNGATGALQITFSLPPMLTAQRTPENQIEVSWPATATEFSLEVSTKLAPAEWYPVQAVPNVSSNRNWLRLPCDGQGNVYRLKRNATP